MYFTGAIRNVAGKTDLMTVSEGFHLFLADRVYMDGKQVIKQKLYFALLHTRKSHTGSL